MSRTTTRRTLRLETLEARELLTAGGPSADAQYMLYLLNTARTNPAEAAQQFTSNLDADVQATLKYYNVNLNQVRSDIASSAARPPLAWNDTLAQTATGQSQFQNNTATQTHAGPNGNSLEQRLNQAGYTNRSSDGENAYAYSTGINQAMQAFMIDWGVPSLGHRDNILQPGASSDQFYREVGIGIVPSTQPNFGPLVITQDFGAQVGAKADLLGVAYNDPNHVNQFTLNSGVGNVQISATNNATGQTSNTQTWNAGGYQMALDPGQYTVTAKVNGQLIRSDQVTIANQNVEDDFNLTNPGASTPTPTQAAPVQTQVAPVQTQAAPVQTQAPASTPTASLSASNNGSAASAATSSSNNSDSNAGWFNSWTSWTAAKSTSPS